jgi:SPP1 family predicted phage head-tail adaptor
MSSRALFRPPNQINAGLLDSRVTLQKRGITQGVSGGPEEVWSNLATGVPAQMIPMKGIEMHSKDAKRMVVMHRVRFILRHRTDLTNLDRIVHDGRIYDITSIDVLGRREALGILAEERI